MEIEAIAETAHGLVEAGACGCLRIQFSKFLWQLSSANFEDFYHYIRDLANPHALLKNLYAPGQVVVAMDKHLMMALLTPQEVYDLQKLLEKARLALFKRQLIRQRQGLPGLSQDCEHSQI